VVAGIRVVLAGHRRNVVRTHRDVVGDVLLVRLHRREHVGRTRVVPGLDEAVGVPLDVPKVNEGDILAEVPDCIRNVGVHRREVPLTERDRVRGAVDRIEHAVVGLDVGDDPRHPTE
jgi:hypothetical protein